MTKTSYSVKVPGKLMIAGEYAVLEPKQEAMVAAINRYVTAYVKRSSRNCLSLPQLGLDAVTWDTDDKSVKFSVRDSRLMYIHNSIAVVNQFLQENSVSLIPFHLTIKSELDDRELGRKYGLGSSAAVVVAAVSSMLQLYSDIIAPPTLEQIFKLSSIAHYITQKSGSGADIAASVYGGWLQYSSFNHVWLLKQLREGENLTKLVNCQWPDLLIIPIKAPSDLKLCVGWTKEPASTAELIKKVHTFRDHQPGDYACFLDVSARAVNDMMQAFANNDGDAAICSLTQNRIALAVLGNKAGIPIETKKLTDLCWTAEMYGSGKGSGAGGGDCGIAFVMGDIKKEQLFRAWEEIGIQPLNIAVSNIGTIFTEYNCEPSMDQYFHHDSSQKHLDN